MKHGVKKPRLRGKFWLGGQIGRMRGRQGEAVCCPAMPRTITPEVGEVPTPTPEPPPLAKEMAVIALGGAIGASLRFSVSLGVGAAGFHAALAADVANLTGSFLLGLVVGYMHSGRAHPLARPFLTVGVFGSFTTFSALALDNRQLAQEVGEALAAARLGGSIVLGLLAFAVGDGLAERIRARGWR